MIRLGQVLTSLAVSTAIVSVSLAQPPASRNPGQNPPAQPPAAKANPRKSIVHHYPYPYPGHYHGDQNAGYRNPGHVGRFLEYYPPGNQFQNSGNSGQDPVKVANFGGGGVPDRNEQLQAQQIGISRYNAIQGHIDRMAQPYIGYGVGYFGGAY